MVVSGTFDILGTWVMVHTGGGHRYGMGNGISQGAGIVILKKRG